MSFDVFLVPLRDSDEPARYAAVLRYLETRRITVDERGLAGLDTPDGGQAELDVFMDEGGFEAGLSVYRLTPEISALVHELAAEGELAVVPAMDETATLLVDASHEGRVGDDELLAAVVVCPSPEALHERLAIGFGQFIEYRKLLTDSTVSDSDLVAEAIAWFADKGFRLLVVQELTETQPNYSADLLSGDGERRLQPRYGCGTSAREAALSARRRYELEQ